MTDRRTRILVIDDSPEYLGFMETLLDSEGYAVTVAGSADEAREQLAMQRPDLIVSDVRLPGVAPFSTLDLIAADDKLRAVPVLFCTGAVREVEEASARLAEYGAEVLLKPFDIDDLLARLVRLLPHRHLS